MAGAQSREALALAQEYKARRYQLGKEIKSGKALLSEVLREPTLPEWLQGETAARLLGRIHRLGPQGVRRLLAELRIGELRRLGALTYRQRRELSARLALEEGRRNSSGRRARHHLGSTAGSTKQQASAGGGS